MYAPTVINYHINDRICIDHEDEDVRTIIQCQVHLYQFAKFVNVVETINTVVRKGFNRS